MNRKHESTAFLPVAAMIFFWSLTPVTIAYIKSDFSLYFQIWLRYLASSIVLWAGVLLNPSLRGSLVKVFSKSLYLPIGLCLGAVATILFQFFYTYCFTLIDPGFGILLYQSQVLFSLLAGAVFFPSERKLLKQKKTILAIVLSLAGAVVVILFGSGGVQFDFNKGILFALLAAVSWSLVGVSNRIFIADRIPPLLTVTLVFTLVTLLLTPVMAFSGEQITGSPSAFRWTVLIGSGLLGIAGGQGLYYYLLPRLGLITAASVQLLVPFITGVMSYFIFGERITVLQVFGGLVLLAGCRLIILQKGRAAAESSDDAMTPKTEKA